MFTKEEATGERVSGYVAALELELSGYEQKLAAAKSSGDTDAAKAAEKRIAGVKAELSRVSAEYGTDAPKGRRKKAAVEEPAEPTEEPAE